jgi:hypothetical protein
MFSLVGIIVNELKDNYSIALPSDFTDYISFAGTVIKMIFITGLIGCATAPVTCISTLFSSCSHAISCINMNTGVITFLAFLICGGAFTGSFLNLRKYLNNSVEEFGARWV